MALDCGDERRKASFGFDGFVSDSFRDFVMDCRIRESFRDLSFPILLDDFLTLGEDISEFLADLGKESRWLLSGRIGLDSRVNSFGALRLVMIVFRH
jgi:hypothetical protein